jgi:hypothetical protein
MSPERSDGDTNRVRVAAYERPIARGSGLLIAHCHAFSDVDERAPVVDRLRLLIGAELTSLLLIALAGDHAMRSRDLAA